MFVYNRSGHGFGLAAQSVNVNEERIQLNSMQLDWMGLDQVSDCYPKAGHQFESELKLNLSLINGIHRSLHSLLKLDLNLNIQINYIHNDRKIVCCFILSAWTLLLYLVAAASRKLSPLLRCI